MKYLVCGNVMLDHVRFADGSASNKQHLGGPATFAYSGIKLYTDDVIQCSNIGMDSLPLFEPWIEKNIIDSRFLKVKTDYSNHSYLLYNEDSTYSGDPITVERFRSDYIQDFGYLKTSPEDIENVLKVEAIKGIYVAQNWDNVFWSKMKKLKEEYRFKIMWEIEEPSSYNKDFEKVLQVLDIIDVFSINIGEACKLFACETEEECLSELQKLKVPLTLFRVGYKGLYSVGQTFKHFVPSYLFNNELVDPTGCGNTSTGAALYSFCEGDDPLMVGIKANLAAAQNIREFGVIQNILNRREETNQVALEIYNFLK